MKRILLSATIVAGAMYFAPTAHAGPSGLVTCPETGFTQEPNAKVENSGGNTSATAKCQYLTPPSQNNVASISNINLAGFFGDTHWADNGQTQVDSHSNLTGTWAINNVNFAVYDYAIFFKDGDGTNHWLASRSTSRSTTASGPRRSPIRRSTSLATARRMACRTTPSRAP